MPPSSVAGEREVAQEALRWPFGDWLVVLAGLGLELLLIWAIFVKGRIIALTINVHPLVGVAISVIVYILRFFASYALAPTG